MTFPYKPALAFILFISLILLGVSTEWWIALAMAATGIIALLIILDGFFFVDGIYKNPREPAAISGVMQGATLLLFPVVESDIELSLTTAVAFMTGVSYTFAFSLYFKSLSEDADAVVISVIWNLMIALVPVLAFLVLDESLSGMQYLGIVLIFGGASIATHKKGSAMTTVIKRMLFATLLLSVGDVAIKWVFERLASEGNPSVFWSGMLPHSAGSLAAGLYFMRQLTAKRESAVSFRLLLVKFWWVFIAMELLQVLSDGMTNLAIAAGDVSVVVGMGGLMGILAMGLVTTLRLSLAGTRLKDTLSLLQDRQFENFEKKIFGMAMVTFGAYLLA